MFQKTEVIDSNKKSNVLFTESTLIDTIKEYINKPLTITGIITFENIDSYTGEITEVAVLKTNENKLIATTSRPVKSTVDMMLEILGDDLKDGLKVAVKTKESSNDMEFFYLEII